MLRSLLAATLAAGLLAGCEGEATGPAALAEGEVTIDASQAGQYTYFNLASGQVVSVTNPATSTDWDIALRRFETRLNGGVLGAKGVTGYNVANNATRTAQEVLAFTPANQRPAFDAVTLAGVPAAAQFETEVLSANPLGWLAFGAQGPVANPSAAWKVRRSSAGGHAVVRATGLTLSGAGQAATLGSVTLEWRYQPAGGTLGAAQTATITLAGGNTAINFATGAVTAPTGCGWDLAAAPSFALSMNAGCSAGTFPVSAAESFSGLTTAAGALDYGAFLSGLAGPIPFNANLDDPRAPYLYNLAGDNRISPTYNVYLIRSGGALYKVQIIGYYNATGASGYPTIRYEQLQ